MFTIILAIWATCFTTIYTQEMTVDDIALLRTTLDELFDNSGTKHPLVGTLVRLTFHDCAGSPENSTSDTESVCDGCVALSSADHLGLKTEVIDILENIFLNDGPDNDTTWQDKMSTADFWMAAGTIAIQYAQMKDRSAGSTDHLPPIPFYFGRDECSTSPDVNDTTTNVKALPSGSDVWDDTLGWFETNFDLNIEETVALIGAHTLGRAHESVSGFRNPWVTDWDTFNNQFYVDLINKDWVQDSGSDNKQWNVGGLMMMNSDIAMWKDINDMNGTVSCSFAECPQNNETEIFVSSFANDNALWLQTFVEAWIKMVTVGYDIGELFVVSNVTYFSTTTTTLSATDMLSTTPAPEDGFDFVEWITENWLFVAIGVVVLILIVCLTIFCCRRLGKRRERNQKSVQMFGTEV